MPRTGASNSASPTVLLVEDDEATAFQRTRVLARAGIEVTAVKNVADALAHSKATRFDVVLADIHLPDGNGYELCRTLRAERPDLPVILISAAYTDDASQATATYAGAVDFLAEPVSAAKLTAAVRAQL